MNFNRKTEKLCDHMSQPDSHLHLQESVALVAVALVIVSHIQELLSTERIGRDSRVLHQLINIQKILQLKEMFMNFPF